MFNVNDYVVYDSTGVYQIVDIRTEPGIDENDTDYYVLEPAFDKNLTVKLPVLSRKIRIRRTLNKAEVHELLEETPGELHEWIEDRKKRAASFKAALKSTDISEWFRVLRTIQIHTENKPENDKPLSAADQNAIRAAEKNVNEEFAVALNISPEEVPAYILDNITRQ